MSGRNKNIQSLGDIILKDADKIQQEQIQHFQDNAPFLREMFMAFGGSGDFFDGKVRELRKLSRKRK